MLLELRIENLLLIERAELRLAPGLNAITGETGAGKTVLAHSLDLLMGGRARPQIVRPGAAEAYVEGVFELPPELFEDPELAELGERVPEGANEIVLGRRVGSSGRTSAFVAGRSASAGDLRALGERLLAFYGQHEHRKLTLAAAQLEILDGFIGSEQIDLRRRYREAHTTAGSLTAELDELRERDGARARELDLLRYELEEIQAATPDPAEEEELEAERLRLRHADGLRLAVAGALEAIEGSDGDGGVAALLAGAESAASALHGVEPRLDDAARRLGELAVEARDLSGELRALLDAAEADPERLAAVEERLELIGRLKRKHGGSVVAVLEHAERCREQVALLERAEERGEEIEGVLAEAIERRAELGSELGERRREAAPELERQVAAELELLAMEGAALEVVLEPHPDGFGPSGAETVELRVATNPGMPVGALRDAASGGELSRLMLALTRLGRGSGAETIVFDEIDAGIGGGTARAVGERLQSLAAEAGTQVVCITHLPQIAALAGAHFLVSKEIAGEATVAAVERLEGEELVGEIRRMLGGRDDDAAATRHARELLAAAA